MRTLVLALLLLLPMATQNSLSICLANAAAKLIASDQSPQATKAYGTDLDDEQRRANSSPVAFIQPIITRIWPLAAAGLILSARDDRPSLAVDKLTVVLRI